MRAVILKHNRKILAAGFGTGVLVSWWAATDHLTTLEHRALFMMIHGITMMGLLLLAAWGPALED